MKRFFIGIFLFAIMFLIPPTTYAGSEVVWTNEIGGENNDQGHSITQTADGDFLIVGQTQSFGHGGSDLWLIKTDNIGDTLWTRTYGGSSRELGRAIQPTLDNSFIITGYTESYGSGNLDVWLLKVNNTGDTLWTKTYGGISEDQGLAVFPTNDGGYLLSGFTASFGAGDYDAWLVKTNSTGDTLWTRTYGGAGEDRGNDVIQSTDGDYVMTGYTNSFGHGSYDLWLLKMDVNGDTLWSQTIGGSDLDYGYSVQNISDGNYVIGGVTTSFGAGNRDVWLVKTNSTGEVLWTKSFGGTSNDECFSVKETRNDELIFTGYTNSYGAGNNDVWLIKTDMNGDTVWTRTIGDVNNDIALEVIETDNHRYLLTGYSAQDGSSTNYDLFVSLIQDSSDGLIAYYPFNGNAIDESGNGHNGALHGDLQLSNDRFGKVNQAYDFDGVDDYISVTNASALNPTIFSLSFWVKINQLPSDTYDIIGKRGSGQTDGITFLLKNDGYLILHWEVSDIQYQVTSLNPLNTNQWYHIVGVYDGATATLFIDGELHNSNSITVAPPTTSDYLGFGFTGNAVEYFDGHIDDIYYYNRALTNSEIQQLYTPPPSITLSIDSVNALVNDTIAVPVRVQYPSDSSYQSAELYIDGYQSGLEFIGVDTAGTLTGDAGWSCTTNETDELLISWVYGATHIDTSGLFTKLQFQAAGTPCTFVPVQIDSAVFDTGDDIVAATDGGVLIHPVPVYGDVDGNGAIQAYDAAMILQHVVEIDTLGCQDSVNADVSLDTTISALDASLVAMYGVGIIDSLPYDSADVNIDAQGTLALEDQTIIPGSIVDVPLQLQDGGNILSFELEIDFDAAYLEFMEFGLSDQAAGFSTEIHATPNRLQIVAAGTEPDGTTGVLGTLQFQVVDDPPSEQTEISLRKLRLNEEPVQSNVSTATLNIPTGIHDELIPTGFTLHQNHPNPFNPTTTLKYGLPQDADVRLVIYDLAGRKVKTLIQGHQSAGWYEVSWNGKNELGQTVSTGVYFYRLVAGDFVDAKKMVFMK